MSPDLLDAIVRAAAEATTLDDLDAEAVPLLERAFDAHLTAVLQFDDEGLPCFRAGNLNRCAPKLYFDDYFSDDPITLNNRQHNQKIIVTDADVDRAQFEKSTAFNEYYRSRDVGRVLATRMVASTWYVPTSVMIGLFRADSQPAYSPRDVEALARVLPSLEAVARRSRRAEIERRTYSVMSAALEHSDARPRVALDRYGHLLWASESGERLLGTHSGRGRTLPDEIAGPARRLAAFAVADAKLEDVAFSSEVRVTEMVSLHVDFRVSRTASGEPFIIADLQEKNPDSATMRVASRQLTRAEASVLECLRLGLSNAEIAQRLFVSVPTVKTHVHRVLQKLGVSSRLQAALVPASEGTPGRSAKPE